MGIHQIRCHRVPAATRKMLFRSSKFIFVDRSSWCICQHLAEAPTHTQTHIHPTHTHTHTHIHNTHTHTHVHHIHTQTYTKHKQFAKAHHKVFWAE